MKRECLKYNLTCQISLKILFLHFGVQRSKLSSNALSPCSNNFADLNYGITMQCHAFANFRMNATVIILVYHGW